MASFKASSLLPVTFHRLVCTSFLYLWRINKYTNKHEKCHRLGCVDVFMEDEMYFKSSIFLPPPPSLGFLNLGPI